MCLYLNIEQTKKILNSKAHWFTYYKVMRFTSEFGSYGYYSPIYGKTVINPNKIKGHIYESNIISEKDEKEKRDKDLKLNFDNYYRYSYGIHVFRTLERAMRYLSSSGEDAEGLKVFKVKCLKKDFIAAGNNIANDAVFTKVTFMERVK